MANVAESRAVSHSESVTISQHVLNTFITLPEDVILQICFWLSVGDILSLRLANKFMNDLTRNSSVWMSILRRLNLALPAGQPVSFDSLDLGPMNTLEFFISRAMRLEHNWREYNPLASHYRFNGHQRILSIRFLPGGKHMVTVSQDAGSEKESVVVWDMNFRARRNHVAIAMLNSESPVHKLHVRYAMVDNEISLVVAFTRPPMEGRTVISAAYISVKILDHLSKLGPGSPAFLEYSKHVPNPFTKVLEMRTRYPIGALSLSDLHNHPVLAAVHRPRTVVFFFLHSGTRASLKLAAVPGYGHWRHSIWDIKILSSQNQLLVIRVLIGEVNTMDTNPLVFELYDIPVGGTETEEPVPRERRLIMDHSIDGFFMSDGEASWESRTHPDSYNHMLHRLANRPPPPISLFVTTKAPRGFIHFLMLPELARGDYSASSAGVSEYTYKLPAGRHAQYEWDEEEHAVIIPGAYRSIVWMRSPRRQPLQGIAVLRLAVYRTEGYTFSDSRDTGHIITAAIDHTLMSTSVDNSGTDRMDFDEDLMVDSRRARPARERSMKYPVVPVDVTHAMRDGTRCLQFDEWLGRLCVATTGDNWIQVLDWSI